MQGFIKGSLDLFLTVHNNGQLEASMEGYSKESLGPFMTVHYNG
jgi:hypothetical protein